MPSSQYKHTQLNACRLYPITTIGLFLCCTAALLLPAQAMAEDCSTAASELRDNYQLVQTRVNEQQIALQDKHGNVRLIGSDSPLSTDGHLSLLKLERALSSRAILSCSGNAEQQVVMTRYYRNRNGTVTVQPRRE